MTDKDTIEDLRAQIRALRKEVEDLRNKRAGKRDKRQRQLAESAGSKR